MRGILKALRRLTDQTKPSWASTVQVALRVAEFPELVGVTMSVDNDPAALFGPDLLKLAREHVVDDRSVSTRDHFAIFKMPDVT